MSWSATLSANNYPRQGFWERQFSAVATTKQTLFDSIFGVILPAAVLVLDPIVFQGNFMGEPALLGKYQIFAYLLCGFQMGLFLLWRSTGRSLSRFSALIGGALIGGAFFSFVVGILIFPYSLLGLIVVIGVAGFTPFFTSFVYVRNGIRAIRFQNPSYSVESRVHMAAWALVLALLLPYVASVQYSNLVDSAVNQLIYSKSYDDAVAAAKLLQWFPVIPSDERRRVYEAYSGEENATKRFVLEQYWKNITGEDLQTHARLAMD
jgi:hypothetical protein